MGPTFHGVPEVLSLRKKTSLYAMTETVVSAIASGQVPGPVDRRDGGNSAIPGKQHATVDLHCKLPPPGQRPMSDQRRKAIHHPNVFAE